MQIIPVIDLKDGCVVSARFGDRHHYRPVESSLCSSASLFDILKAFLNLHEFNTIYIADLNAISGNGDHNGLISKVINEYPHIEFWLDDGSQLTDLANPPLHNLTPVIGTESQHSFKTKPHDDFILSLDFQGEQRLGLQSLFDCQESWPQNIILMTLNKVGSNSGPDFVLLHQFTQRFPNKCFVAAGGIRDIRDLTRVRDIGVNKALIASALHSGKIGAKELRLLASQ